MSLLGTLGWQPSFWESTLSCSFFFVSGGMVLWSRCFVHGECDVCCHRGSPYTWSCWPHQGGGVSVDGLSLPWSMCGCGCCVKRVSTAWLGACFRLVMHWVKAFTGNLAGGGDGGATLEASFSLLGAHCRATSLATRGSRGENPIHCWERVVAPLVLRPSWRRDC